MPKRAAEATNQPSKRCKTRHEDEDTAANALLSLDKQSSVIFGFIGHDAGSLGKVEIKRGSHVVVHYDAKEDADEVFAHAHAGDQLLFQPQIALSELKSLNVRGDVRRMFLCVEPDNGSSVLVLCNADYSKPNLLPGTTQIAKWAMSTYDKMKRGEWFDTQVLPSYSQLRWLQTRFPNMNRERFRLDFIDQVITELKNRIRPTNGKLTHYTVKNGKLTFSASESVDWDCYKPGTVFIPVPPPEISETASGATVTIAASAATTSQDATRSVTSQKSDAGVTTAVATTQPELDTTGASAAVMENVSKDATASDAAATTHPKLDTTGASAAVMENVFKDAIASDAAAQQAEGDVINALLTQQIQTTLHRLITEKIVDCLKKSFSTAAHP
jgi:hypothetical protein